MFSFRRYAYLCLLLWCSACSLFQQADHFGAHPVNFGELHGWEQDNHAQALATFEASCPILAQKPRGRSTGSGLSISDDVWRSLCLDAKQVHADDNIQARVFFEKNFSAYRVTNNGRERGLFTGYYEPVLYGSLHKHGDFIYPLYRIPPGQKTNVPSLTRAQIDNGALSGKQLELLWVDDPVMLFFLQIQGSGRVRLENGREILVGYAGQNGYPYVSLGKVMGDEGLIPKDQINFFTLRQWLYAHPDKAFALMERNPSYVFFKRLDQSGPVGAVGAVLTPQRSLAVDSAYIPYGLPLFMETELPGQEGASPVPFNRLLIAQDTGGAIRGPVRGDIFFGGGTDAEYLAGYMKGHGIYSLLVPKDVENQLH